MKKDIKITIIDYDNGNLESVYRACDYVGMTPKISRSQSEINQSDAIILPGVGAFGGAMKCLKERNLIDPIYNFIKTGKIVVGKDENYAGIGTAGDSSNLQFYTTLNGTDTERLRITMDGESRFTGDISGSGEFLGKYGFNMTGSGGHHGNENFIPLLPSDFNLSTDSARAHGVYTDDDGASSRNVNAAANLYAMKIIPKGFTATGVRVNCSVTIAGSVTPHDGTIADASAVNDHTAGATNADVSFSGTVSAVLLV